MTLSQQENRRLTMTYKGCCWAAAVCFVFGIAALVFNAPNALRAVCAAGVVLFIVAGSLVCVFAMWRLSRR